MACVAVAALCMLVLGFALRRSAMTSQQEDDHVASLAESIPLSSIARLPAAGRVHVQGRIVPAGEQRIVAPLSKESALWSRSRLENNVGDLCEDWICSVDSCLIADAAGQHLAIKLKDAEIRKDDLPYESIDQQRAQQFLADHGRQGRNASGFTYEQVLYPGESLHAIGTLAPADPAAPDQPRTLHAASTGDLVLFDPDDEEQRSERDTRLVGWSRGLMVTGAFGLAAALLLWLLTK